jgi:hypothetical protein
MALQGAAQISPGDLSSLIPRIGQSTVKKNAGLLPAPTLAWLNINYVIKVSFSAHTSLMTAANPVEREPRGAKNLY